MEAMLNASAIMVWAHQLDGPAKSGDTRDVPNYEPIPNCKTPLSVIRPSILPLSGGGAPTHVGFG